MAEIDERLANMTTEQWASAYQELLALRAENEDLKRELEILNGAISASIDILSKKVASKS